MSDDQLTYGSMFIEFGLPILMLVLLKKDPSRRWLYVPVLGAVSLMALVLLGVLFSEFMFPPEGPSMNMAAFAMGLFIFCAMAFFGVVLAMALPQYISLLFRYNLSFVLGPVFGFGVLALWPW